MTLFLRHTLFDIKNLTNLFVYLSPISQFFQMTVSMHHKAQIDMLYHMSNTF